MKLKELIDILKAHDPEIEVVLDLEYSDGISDQNFIVKKKSIKTRPHS